MKTLIVSGESPVPERLRDLITRGSTSVDQRRAADFTSVAIPDVDRVVFWSTGDEPELRQLAERQAKAEKAEGRETVVFVTTQRREKVPGLSPTEMYSWPEDEDRLTMAFLTGA